LEGSFSSAHFLTGAMGRDDFRRSKERIVFDLSAVIGDNLYPKQGETRFQR
jgi:hypothetical protein